MRKYSKLMVVLMAFIVVFALTACGGGAKPAAEPSATDEAVTALSESLDAFKNADMDAINEMAGGDMIGEVQDTLGGDDEMTSTFIKTIFGHMDYTVEDTEEVDENTVNVKVKIKNVDMMAAVKSMYSELILYAATNPDITSDNDALTKKIVESLSASVENTAKEEDGVVEKEVTIKMVKKDGQWKVDDCADNQEEILSVITGGIGDAMSSLNSGGGNN